jgi:hypothetical protein
MLELIKVKVTESNFHEDLLPGREIELNLAHVRFFVHDQDSTLLFFQNDDCLRVKPRLELPKGVRTSSRSTETGASL